MVKRIQKFLKKELNKKNLKKRLKGKSPKRALEEFLYEANNEYILNKIKSQRANYDYWTKNHLLKFIKRFNYLSKQQGAGSNWCVFLDIIQLENPSKERAFFEQRMKPVFKEFEEVYIKPRFDGEARIRKHLKELKGSAIKQVGQLTNEQKMVKDKLDHLIKTNEHDSDPHKLYVSSNGTMARNDDFGMSEPVVHPLLQRQEELYHNLMNDVEKIIGGALTLQTNNPILPNVPASGPPPGSFHGNRGGGVYGQLNQLPYNADPIGPTAPGGPPINYTGSGGMIKFENAQELYNFYDKWSKGKKKLPVNY